MYEKVCGDEVTVNEGIKPAMSREDFKHNMVTGLSATVRHLNDANVSKIAVHPKVITATPSWIIMGSIFFSGKKRWYSP